MSTPSVKPAAPGVSEARFARLARGINASHWFAQSHSYDQAHLRSYNTLEDIKLIRSIGFDHIRFTLNPEILLNPREPTSLRQDNLDEMDAALDMILGQGLAVIVDIHPEDDFKRKLAGSDAAVDTFATFWRALAKHLSARNPEWVTLEVLNEPVMKDPQRWTMVQATVLAAMRVGAPEHTLIATGYEWSGLPQLLLLEPLADPNIIYNFHCYDPHDFTHQAAIWGASYWPHLEYLPYPSSPEAIEPLLPQIKDERAHRAALEYGAERWDAEKLDAWLGLAAAWAARHNVRVTCNEFGVYRLKSRPEHRNAWIRDVRTALEKYNIGWTMWDYAGGFSVVTTQNGRREVDPETVRALGLA
jgi:endoglucanase